MKTRESVRYIQLAVAAILLVTLGACAVGNRHDYGVVKADFQVSGDYALALATLDQRDYVLSLHKSPNFVGLQRGGFGNPFDVITEDGKPLSDNVTQVLANSLKARGFTPVAIQTDPRSTTDEAVKKLVASSSRRSLLVILREWKTDTYSNVALHYNVVLEIRDNEGKIMATSRVEGKDNLGGSAWNPPAVARAGAPRALKEKLERLLNDPEVSRALREP